MRKMVRMTKYRGHSLMTSREAGGKWRVSVWKPYAEDHDDPIFTAKAARGGMLFANRLDALSDGKKFVDERLPKRGRPRKKTDVMETAKTVGHVEVAMQEVKAWRAKDGKLYETHEQAAYANAVADLRELVDWCGMGSGGDWSPDMICACLLNHADKFSPILNILALTPK